MAVQRKISRRAFTLSGAAIGAAASILSQESAHAGTLPATSGQRGTMGGATGVYMNATEFGLVSGLGKDQSTILQSAIDRATERGATLLLPPGRLVAGNIVLRDGTRISGAGPHTVLAYGGSGAMLRGTGLRHIVLRDFSVDGGSLPLDRQRTRALIEIDDAHGLVIDTVAVRSSSADGIALKRCAGRLASITVDGAADAGIFSIDADTASGAVEISSAHVRDCRDNGILIWRSAQGADASRVSSSTITRIGNRSGGSGQFGNGVNVYRAGGVSVSGCRITDCAYSAVRGNAADNIQMLGNRAGGIGEVALYSEFGFNGAVIASNVVDGAASGIAVTNFDRGGRLAVVQGNLVRNLRRREHEPVDKRGEGIAVEADAAVSGNVVEGAATVGILIGWGKHMRDVAATGNVIRSSGIGIGVSVSAGTGSCIIANNVISDSRRGTIVGMDHSKIIAPDLSDSSLFRNVRVSANIVA